MLAMGKVEELSSVPGDNFARWPEGTPDLEYCIRIYFVRLLGAVFLSPSYLKSHHGQKYRVLPSQKQKLSFSKVGICKLTGIL